VPGEYTAASPRGSIAAWTDPQSRVRRPDSRSRGA
jgi:hypothetical protein